MSNIIQALEAEQINAKNIPEFSPGDTVVVQIKVKEGSRERLQAFEGVVIAIRKRGIGSSFKIRKISHGVGVERTFQTYSHQIASITRKRRGAVRQAKLYYLRELSGRKARIKEKLDLSGKRKKATSKSSGSATAAPAQKTDTAKPASQDHDATTSKDQTKNQASDNQDDNNS